MVLPLILGAISAVSGLLKQPSNPLTQVIDIAKSALGLEKKRAPSRKRAVKRKLKSKTRR